MSRKPGKKPAKNTWSLKKRSDNRDYKYSSLNSSQQKAESAHDAQYCYQNKDSADKSDYEKTRASTEELAVSTVLEASLPRFGPLYGEDMEFIKRAKEEAWQHILNKDSEDSSSNKKKYLMSVRKIEEKAKKTYNNDTVNEMKKPNEFAWRMVLDGCFFLQLALYTLGGGDYLGYPANHPYFGKNVDKGEWIHAMFFVGNQIPWVVIRELMRESFFNDVIKTGIEKGTWRRPKELPKLVLYLTVVEPELERSGPSLLSKLMMIFKKEAPRFQKPPFDILHALHCLLLGPGNDPVYLELNEFQDIETGKEDDRFPSARELKRSWIVLKKAKEGITNIHFQNFFFFAYLYVPPFKIDADTEVMLKNVMDYERQLGEGDREVTAYLQFIRDLIQTHKDFKILKKKRIIEVKDNELKKKTRSMLDSLVSSQKSNFTPNLRQTRHKITEYGGPPWRLVGGLISFLTVVQTILAILSYVKPIK